VCWGYHKPEALVEAGAARLFNSTDELRLAVLAKRGIALKQAMA
jgi:hypothetical protein